MKKRRFLGSKQFEPNHVRQFIWGAEEKTFKSVIKVLNVAFVSGRSREKCRWNLRENSRLLVNFHKINGVMSKWCRNGIKTLPAGCQKNPNEAFVCCFPRRRCCWDLRGDSRLLLIFIKTQPSVIFRVGSGVSIFVSHRFAVKTLNYLNSKEYYFSNE